jgi:hypothetical protein
MPPARVPARPQGKLAGIIRHVMRHPDGDKVIIKRGADNHYLYFSVLGTTTARSLISCSIVWV